MFTIYFKKCRIVLLSATLVLNCDKIDLFILIYCLLATTLKDFSTDFNFGARFLIL